MSGWHQVLALIADGAMTLGSACFAWWIYRFDARRGLRLYGISGATLFGTIALLGVCVLGGMLRWPWLIAAMMPLILALCVVGLWYERLARRQERGQR
ncbi:MAG: hypothetical protein H0X24_16380 [Ktedonobacterales bacterium]|nr:hypothetical protein [Ktedonobacterales bacterium]